METGEAVARAGEKSRNGPEAKKLLHTGQTVGGSGAEGRTGRGSKLAGLEVAGREL